LFASCFTFGGRWLNILIPVKYALSLNAVSLTKIIWRSIFCIVFTTHTHTHTHTHTNTQTHTNTHKHKYKHAHTHTHKHKHTHTNTNTHTHTHTNTHTHTQTQTNTHTHTHTQTRTHARTHTHRESQEEHARLWEGVPYGKVYRYNPKHLCPQLNGYRDNGQRKVWSSVGSTHCSYQLTSLNQCLSLSDVWCYVSTGYSWVMYSIWNPNDKNDMRAGFTLV
jgi:hypothetical protein